MKRGDALVLVTIYDHPLDYPDGYLAREWSVSYGVRDPTPGQVVATGPLEQVRRSLIERGMTRIARSPEDAPAILETWL